MDLETAFRKWKIQMGDFKKDGKYLLTGQIGVGETGSIVMFATRVSTCSFISSMPGSTHKDFATSKEILRAKVKSLHNRVRQGEVIVTLHPYDTGSLKIEPIFWSIIWVSPFQTYSQKEFAAISRAASNVSTVHYLICLDVCRTKGSDLADYPLADRQSLICHGDPAAMYFSDYVRAMVTGLVAFSEYKSAGTVSPGTGWITMTYTDTLSFQLE